MRPGPTFPFLLMAALAVAAPPGGSAAEGAPELQPRMKGRPLLVSMNRVLDGLWPRFAAAPADEARRVSIRHGLLGLGSHDPRGGAEAPGRPPLRLFARAGFGNSALRDPVSGLDRFTHTP